MSALECTEIAEEPRRIERFDGIGLRRCLRWIGEKFRFEHQWMIYKFNVIDVRKWAGHACALNNGCMRPKSHAYTMLHPPPLYMYTTCRFTSCVNSIGFIFSVNLSYIYDVKWCNMQNRFDSDVFMLRFLLQYRSYLTSTHPDGITDFFYWNHHRKYLLCTLKHIRTMATIWVFL